MKRVLIIIFIILLIFTGCSSNNKNTTEKTIDEIVEEKSITKGKLQSVIPTKTYQVSLNIGEVGKISQYEDLSTIVYFDTVGEINNVERYFSEDFYMSVYDKYFNSLEGDNIYLIDKEVSYESDAFQIRIAQELKPNLYNKAEYLVIGGLDRQFNSGNDKKIFKIK